MKKITDPFAAESKKKSEKEKQTEKIAEDIVKSLTRLFSVKEFRILLTILVGCVIVTGLIYDILIMIDYWKVSVPTIALISWRMYALIKNNPNKK